MSSYYVITSVDLVDNLSLGTTNAIGVIKTYPFRSLGTPAIPTATHNLATPSSSNGTNSQVRSSHKDNHHWYNQQILIRLDDNASMDFEFSAKSTSNYHRIYARQMAALPYNKISNLSYNKSNSSAPFQLTLTLTRYSTPPTLTPITTNNNTAASSSVPPPPPVVSLTPPVVQPTQVGPKYNPSLDTSDSGISIKPKFGLGRALSGSTPTGSRPTPVVVAPPTPPPKPDNRSTAWEFQEARLEYKEVAPAQMAFIKQLPDRTIKCEQIELPQNLLGVRFLRIANSKFGAIAIADDGGLYEWTYDSTSCYFLSGRPVPKMDSVTVVDIAAGYDHFLAVTAEREIYAWGSNQFRQCTPSDNTRVDIPAKLGLRNVLSCAAGGHSSLAVDQDGIVFTWGRAQMSVRQPNNAPRPVQEDEATGLPVAQSTHHVALVDFLGHGDSQTKARANPRYVSTPLPVAMNQKTSVQQASMSSNIIVLVTREGSVYSWGDANAVCGFSKDAYSSTPQQIFFPEGVRIVKALAGRRHVLALDTSGTLWWWGHLFFTGHPQSKGVSKPTQVKIPGGDTIVDFGISELRSAVLTTQSELWVWQDLESPTKLAPVNAGEKFTALSHGPDSLFENIPYGSERNTRIRSMALNNIDFSASLEAIDPSDLAGELFDDYSSGWSRETPGEPSSEPSS